MIAVVAGACSRRAARVGSRHVRGSSRADLSRWRGGGECVRFLARSRRGGPRDRTPRPTWGRARSSRADSCSGSEWAAYRRHESTWRKGLVRENLRSAPLRFSLTLSIPRRTHGGGWVEGGRVCVVCFGDDKQPLFMRVFRCCGCHGCSDHRERLASALRAGRAVGGGGSGGTTAPPEERCTCFAAGVGR